MRQKPLHGLEPRDPQPKNYVSEAVLCLVLFWLGTGGLLYLLIAFLLDRPH